LSLSAPSSSEPIPPSVQTTEPTGYPVDTRPTLSSFEMARATDLYALVSLDKDLGQGSRPEDPPALQRFVIDESLTPSLQNIIHPTGLRESARDDGRINEVLETLIPSLHELP
jgi:hypothetical protein